MSYKINKVSIVIPVKNEGGNVRLTLDSFLNTAGSIPYEIVVVDDASEDDCCSFLREDAADWQGRGVRLIKTGGVGSANARNAGADQTTGELLIFSDAHVVVEQDWLNKMVENMLRPGVDVLAPGIADYSNPISVGFGQSWDEKLDIRWLPAPAEVSPVPLAPGGLEAVWREVFDSVGGFERGFKIWGYEDVEFSFKCWLHGFQVFVTPHVIVKHIFRPRHTYFISFNEVYYNLMRMAISHFNQKRLGKTVGMISGTPEVEKILADIVLSDVWEQRRKYFQQRKFDDDWFMQKFQIPF